MGFCGRNYELRKLQAELETEYSSLVTIYGRRRVGKTRLVREAFQNHLWFFEGIEGLSKQKQIARFLLSLSEQSKDVRYQYMTNVSDWGQVFSLLHEAWKQAGKPIIFLDELQWMASYRKSFVSLFKAAWERYWSLDKRATVILCGSVSSFMKNQVVDSTALYQRITTVIRLEPLSIREVKDFLAKRFTKEDILDIYMVIGGIPKYLEYIDKNKSVTLNINELFFCKDGQLMSEFESLFHRNFKDQEKYRSIVEYLAKHQKASFSDIANAVGKSSGGTLSKLLNNLELTGFIEKQSPVDSKISSRNLRYSLIDEYTIFYLKFIKPRLKKIQANTRTENMFSSISVASSFEKWKGLAFERLCYKHADLLAEKLGFSSVFYLAGPYFKQGNEKEEGTQIDLMFIRDDRVITLCELKYHQKPLGLSVIKECQKKVEMLEKYFPKHAIHPCLISMSGANDNVHNSGYFTKILTVEDFF